MDFCNIFLLKEKLYVDLKLPKQLYRILKANQVPVHGFVISNSNKKTVIHSTKKQLFYSSESSSRWTQWWLVANLKIHLCTLGAHPLAAVFVGCIDCAVHLRRPTWKALLTSWAFAEAKRRVLKETPRLWYPFSWLSCLVCD